MVGKRIGTYIQDLRQQCGVSIRHLAEQIEMSHSHISMIERGQREVSLNTLYSIIEALDGDFAWAMWLLAIDDGIPEEALPQKVHCDG